MDRARAAFRRQTSSPEEYEPLATAEDGTTPQSSAIPFSWIEYSIFGVLGIAMLWAWNMFLAAAPYFSSRFHGSPWIQSNFQSAILTVSTITSLGVLLILSNIQYSASYPFRIGLALLINSIVFVLLTSSTAVFLDASPAVYFAFLLAVVALSSWATGLIQNGAFAFAASFARPEYMQALMAGQGVAGVLPAIAQVTTVLMFPPREETSDATDDGKREGEASAFFYFLAAVIVSVLALIALVPLVKRHNRRVEGRMVDRMAESITSIEEAERASRKVTSLWVLFRKLRWLATGITLNFAITMVFPVFTAKIHSVREDAGAIFRPAAFIPLGFLFWNLGDLGGRVATMLPFPFKNRPFVLFLLVVARIGLVPLYLLCNIDGRGAIVSSDFFYLFVVQILFGASSGWLASGIMMVSGEWVDEGEREATGAFMGLCLIIGLTAGSLLSFAI